MFLRKVSQQRVASVGRFKSAVATGKAMAGLLDQIELTDQGVELIAETFGAGRNPVVINHAT